MNQTASTILAQLSPQGHRGLKTMLGAGPFLATPNSVKFRFKGSRSLNLAEIQLNGEDTYDITLGRIKGSDYTEVSRHTGIYAEDLRRTFEDETGLTTAIPRIVAHSSHARSGTNE